MNNNAIAGPSSPASRPPPSYAGSEIIEATQTFISRLQLLENAATITGQEQAYSKTKQYANTIMTSSAERDSSAVRKNLTKASTCSETLFSSIENPMTTWRIQDARNARTQIPHTLERANFNIS